MSKMLEGKVAVVTGAGGAIGGEIAKMMAAEGASVVVNDLGGSVSGDGGDEKPARDIVAFIEDNGGKAIPHFGSVADRKDSEDMIKTAMDVYGKVDVVVNNAGILRDVIFHKMSQPDWQMVLDVHLTGSFNVARSAAPYFREQGSGSFVHFTSTSGLIGNFGQANYGAAKAAMMGLMNVLHLEGARDNIRVNTLAPTAATRMTEKLMPPEALELLDPATITPGVLYLVSEDAPSRVILGAGAGSFAVTKVYETLGETLTGDDLTPEGVAAAFEKISDPEGQQELTQAFHQTQKYTRNAAEAKGLKLDWG